MADSFHWADITADKIIREKGDKELYVCASGITRPARFISVISAKSSPLH